MVEALEGSRNKFGFGPESGTSKLKDVLPEGHSFSHDFDFVPSTKASDGNPLDILLLDAPTFRAA